MADMKYKKNGISFTTAVSSVGFDRNFSMLLEEELNLRREYRELCDENERKGLNSTILREKTSDDGQKIFFYEIQECESQVKLWNELHHTQQLIALFKNAKSELIGIAANHINANTIKAKLPRAPKDYYGLTLDDVIRKLSLSHPDEKPINIWPHLKTAIHEWSGEEVKEKKEINGLKGREKDSAKYQYEINEKTDTISYGVFRKKLSNFKKIKNNGF